MQKESRLLKIGVLGAGPIAQSAHLDACRKARNAELYAICDVAPDLVTAVAAIHAPSVVYHDFGALLADPQVDAVIIGVADPFHVPLSLQALGEDAYTYKLQIEGFADTILHGARRSRARAPRTAWPRCGPWSPSPVRSKPAGASPCAM